MACLSYSQYLDILEKERIRLLEIGGEATTNRALSVVDKAMIQKLCDSDIPLVMMHVARHPGHFQLTIQEFLVAERARRAAESQRSLSRISKWTLVVALITLVVTIITTFIR